jgi:hypothetical protein
MLGRVSHLEIENTCTHLPNQELVEGLFNEVGVDFKKNGRGVLKYFRGLKRRTIYPGSRYYFEFMVSGVISMSC